MPIIGLLLGGISFAHLQLKIGEATVNYGAFIQNIVDFLIIAFSIFIIMRSINNMREQKEEEPAPPAPPEPSKEELLLEEIRDILKQK